MFYNERYVHCMQFAIFILLLGHLSQSSEVVSGNSSFIQVNEYDLKLDTGACTDKQIIQNSRIRKNCKSNWKQLGLEAPPVEAELRGLKECSTSYIEPKLVEGCTSALIALPVKVGELAALGAAAYAQEPSKDSFIYVYQNGTLDEIKSYLSNEFFRETCGIAPSDINTFPSVECPDAESHIDLHAHQQCRADTLKAIAESKKCHRAQRAAYQSQVPEINKTAMEIFNAREKFKRLESRRALEFKNVRENCRPHINPFGSVSSPVLSPSLTAARGAKALQNFLYANDQEVESFNQCVNKNTMNNPEFRADLIESSRGLIEQIIGHANSMHCFNLRERTAMTCRAAHIVYSAGGVLVAKSVLKKASNVTAKRIYTRLGRSAAFRKITALKRKNPEKNKTTVGETRTAEEKSTSRPARDIGIDETLLPKLPAGQ